MSDLERQGRTSDGWTALMEELREEASQALEVYRYVPVVNVDRVLAEFIEKVEGNSTIARLRDENWSSIKLDILLFSLFCVYFRIWAPKVVEIEELCKRILDRPEVDLEGKIQTLEKASRILRNHGFTTLPDDDIHLAIAADTVDLVAHWYRGEQSVDMSRMAMRRPNETRPRRRGRPMSPEGEFARVAVIALLGLPAGQIVEIVVDLANEFFGANTTPANVRSIIREARVSQQPTGSTGKEEKLKEPE